MVSHRPVAASYSVGRQGSAVVTISGSNAVPTVTLSSATTYLQKGQPYDVTISLSEAMSTPLTIDLTYGGSAAAGNRLHRARRERRRAGRPDGVQLPIPR